MSISNECDAAINQKAFSNVILVNATEIHTEYHIYNQHEILFFHAHFNQYNFFRSEKIS